MSTQQPLFDVECRPDAEPTCLQSETNTDTVSAMADKRSVRRLLALAAKVEATSDPIRRAALAADIRNLADRLVADSINQANQDGLTWRQIGAELGVPFQTLYRRYGAP